MECSAGIDSELGKRLSDEALAGPSCEPQAKEHKTQRICLGLEGNFYLL
jgi:hypothetical protein